MNKSNNEPTQKPEYAIKRKKQLLILTLILRGISILLIPLLLGAMVYRNNQHIPPLFLIIITSVGFGLLFFTAYTEFYARSILFLDEKIRARDRDGEPIPDPDKKGSYLIDSTLRSKYDLLIRFILAMPGGLYAYESDIRFHLIIYPPLIIALMSLFTAIGWIEPGDTSPKILGLGILFYSLTIFINITIIIHRMGLRRASDDIEINNDIETEDNNDIETEVEVEGNNDDKGGL